MTLLVVYFNAEIFFLASTRVNTFCQIGQNAQRDDLDSLEVGKLLALGIVGEHAIYTSMKVIPRHQGQLPAFLTVPPLSSLIAELVRPIQGYNSYSLGRLPSPGIAFAHLRVNFKEIGHQLRAAIDGHLAGAIRLDLEL